MRAALLAAGGNGHGVSKEAESTVCYCTAYLRNRRHRHWQGNKVLTELGLLLLLPSPQAISLAGLREFVKTNNIPPTMTTQQVGVHAALSIDQPQHHTGPSSPGNVQGTPLVRSTATAPCPTLDRRPYSMYSMGKPHPAHVCVRRTVQPSHTRRTSLSHADATPHCPLPRLSITQRPIAPHANPHHRLHFRLPP